jgi:phage baseplate assembly protein W
VVNEHIRDREYIGQGLAFPLQVNPRGEIAIASGERDIEQSIRIILGTMIGERVMRPEFGCRIHELVFAPHNAATEGLAELYIREALDRWEPRVTVVGVEIANDQAQDGALLIEVKYRVRDTYHERSIVYPFYLSGEQEPGEE